jgi:hypothetical protein
MDDESARGAVERSRSATIEAMPYFGFGALVVIVVVARLIRAAGPSIVGRRLALSAPAWHREVDVGLFDEDFGFGAERVSNFVDDRMGGEPLFVVIEAPVGKHTSEVVEERTGHGEQGTCRRLRLDRRAVIDARREGAERKSMVEVATASREDAVVVRLPKRGDFLLRLLVPLPLEEASGADAEGRDDASTAAFAHRARLTPRMKTPHRVGAHSRARASGEDLPRAVLGESVEMVDEAVEVAPEVEVQKRRRRELEAEPLGARVLDVHGRPLDDEIPRLPHAEGVAAGLVDDPDDVPIVNTIGEAAP